MTEQVRSSVQLFIDGEWVSGAGGKTFPFVNLAIGEGLCVFASAPDLQRSVLAAEKGMLAWSQVSAFERYRVMRKAVEILRSRADSIARTMTLEQGKPFAEAKGETLSGADLIDWYAEEGRRAYGRTIAPRSAVVNQYVIYEPVGPVAAFTPWNFPINQAVRETSGALAAGCSIVIKGPETTPVSCAELVRAFADAGLPAGALNLVFGTPGEISGYLISHPAIRKISFTGSTAVGKQLAAMAGRHMKRMTMELGGHAPAIVCGDADVAQAAELLCTAKFRNAGQVCVSPTRLLVHESLFDRFLDIFITRASQLRVGDGLTPNTEMGPLAHAGRVSAMEALVSDAVDKGAKVLLGGKRIAGKGFFFEPTVLVGVGREARIMNEEPFGPIALIASFSKIEEALEEANRLPYGLGAYAYTKSAQTADMLGRSIRSGMVSINHHGLGLPETPFGGIMDSGFGSEGGSEALESYLQPKFVTHLQLAH